ncbi:MAG TPA: WD40 repeat domain-containing serine/threonine-protein kinase, partial [Candidatus Paceibacterota bacterium]|nr:WD40 repeat domain-containing serine/threonine-protein kinase [Candidatus Paceibacterota bacterium]
RATTDSNPPDHANAPLSTLNSPLSTSLTLSGQVLGSPSYLSPEMAEGKRTAVGVGSDVYSLGAVLYHLLTGRPPFQGETLTALLRQVIETDPVAPRRLNPSIPRDLETLCLKCLEKEPRRRYATALDVADELGRFLADEPIRARPAGRIERLWRWCRRNPRLAGAMSAVVLSLMLGLVTTTWQMRRAQRSEMTALQRAYVSDMDLATRALAEGDIGRVRDLLDRYAAPTKPTAPTGHRPSTINHRPSTDLRGWEWQYLWMKSSGQGDLRLCTRRKQVSSLAFTADSRRLLVHERQGVTLVYDLSTRQPVPGLILTNRSWHLGFCPVSNRVACQVSPEPWQDGEVRLWDLESNTTAFRHTYQDDEFASFAFSPDGQRLAGFAYVRGVCVWDLTSEGAMTTIPAEPAAGNIWSGAVAFDPTGQTLAVGHRTNGLVRLHRVSDGRVDAEFRLPADPVMALAFSPDGRWLAASALATNAVVRVWPLPSGEPMELAGQSIAPLALAFDPQSQVFATGDGELIRLWDLQRRRPITTLVGHRLGVTALAFSPDGRQLASGSNATGAEDAEVRLWDVATVARPAQPDYQVLSNIGLVAFERDARSFLALADGAVTRFDLVTLEPIEPLRLYGTNNSSLSVSKDGRWLANAETNGMVHVWDQETHQECASFRPYPDTTPERGTMRILARGRLLLSRPNNVVQHPMNLWDTRTGQQPEPWHSLNTEARLGCITAEDSMDGRLLATGHFDGRVLLWDAESGDQLAAFDAHRECVMEVAFSPDGRWLASAGWDGALRLWDVHRREAAGQFGRTEAPAYGITFSPDGRRAASGGLTGPVSVGIWDVATREHLTGLVGPGCFFFAPRFSPDGRTLAVWKYTEDVTCFWRVNALEDIDRQK